MITIKGFELKTELADMTVNEFEHISKILNNSQIDNVEKYCQVLEFLGMSDQIINELTDEEFYEIIRAFTYEPEYSKMTPTIECDGRKYRAYEDEGELILKVKDLNYIEKAAKNEKNYLSKILAIVFKQEELTATEHYTPAHIAYKAELFGKLNAQQMAPYILTITNKITEGVEKHITNGPR
jgi:hypothetical protein